MVMPLPQACLKVAKWTGLWVMQARPASVAAVAARVLPKVLQVEPMAARPAQLPDVKLLCPSALLHP
jgi:hypothetical protein